MQPIFFWERAIKTRPDITFNEFRLENHLVLFAFGEVTHGSRSRKTPIKWTCDGKCYLRYTSTRYPKCDLNITML